MKYSIVFFCLLFSIVSVAQDGKLKRELNSFSEVHVKGNIDLFFIPSDKSYVEIIGKNPEDIITEVEQGILEINHRKGKNWVSSEWNTIGKGLQVYVYAPNVKSLHSSGSGNINIEGVLKSDFLEMTMNGSGNVTGTIIIGKLNLNNNGSSNIRLRGGVDQAVINSNGSGNIQSFDLVVDNCNLSKSGSGNAQLTVNVSLHASISGSGNFTYKGNPHEVTTSSSGTGKIRKAN